MLPQTFMLGCHPIGTGRCLVIGEVGLAHDGSLGLAHRFIDAIADAGADAVKFQTHLAEAEGTAAEQFRVHFSVQDATRSEYWLRTAFTALQWEQLAKHAYQRGLLFLSSPFSAAAADLLRRIGVAAWKVASGELNNRPLIENLADDGIPILVSTGMSGWTEIAAAVGWVRARGAPVALFQCSSEYPCPPERVGLNVIGELRRHFACPVGLSDHSGMIFSSIAAAALGLDLLEVHVTLSRHMFGPDVAASLTVEEFRQTIEGIRFVERAMASPVDKDAVEYRMIDMRRLFNKSVVSARQLPAGTILASTDLDVKKPGTGIAAARLSDLIGRRLVRGVLADEILVPADVEGFA
jgi:N,N'-diacetyllegionaminate synthase